LSRAEIAQALAAGTAEARRFLDRGLIRGAALMLRGEAVTVGAVPALT
jgi:hypothetical protein